MSSSNNVLLFPKSENPRPSIKNSEELRKDLEEQKQSMIEKMTEHYSTSLLSDLAMSGLDTSSDTFIKDFTFVTESLKSLYCRAAGIDHPLQETVDEIVKIYEKESDIDTFDE